MKWVSTPLLSFLQLSPILCTRFTLFAHPLVDGHRGSGRGDGVAVCVNTQVSGWTWAFCFLGHKTRRGTWRRHPHISF